MATELSATPVPRRHRAAFAGLLAVAAIATLPLAVGTATAAPTDTMTLTDDTGLLTVDVPVGWTDVTTSPAASQDGTTVPQIVAAPNQQLFYDTFDTPGMIYTARAFESDTAKGVTAAYDFTGMCQDGGITPYSDDYFIGSLQTWTACGGGASSIVTVMANPPDSTFSAVVLIQVPTATDQDAVQIILGTFFVTNPTGNADGVGEVPAVPATNAPVVPATVAPNVPPATFAPAVSVVPAVPTVPVVPAVPTVPAVPAITAPVVPVVPAATVAPTPTAVPDAGAALPPSTDVVDDTGTLYVAVPLDWTGTITTPVYDELGNELPAIVAAPDLQQFSAGTGTGMYLLAETYTTDLEAVMTRIAPPGCTGGPPQPYDDGFFTGFVQQLPGCNGYEVTILAVNPVGRVDHTISGEIVVTPDDTTTVGLILGTFNFTSPDQAAR